MSTFTADASRLGPLRRLDGWRGSLLRSLATSPWGRWVAHRERRVGALALVAVAQGLLLTLVAPGALYVLGPVLLGVPHVASDVRYLLLRRPWPSTATAAMVMGACALVVLAALPASWTSHRMATELTLGLTLSGGLAILLGRITGRWGRALLVLGVVALVAQVTHRRPGLALAVLAYGHNVVGLLLWAFAFHRRRGRALATVVVTLAAAGSLLLPKAVRLAAWGGPFGEVLAEAAMTTGVPFRWAPGVALSFVFLQAVHYAAWLVWIPQDDTQGAGPPTLTMTHRNLLRDFTPWGLGLVLAAMMTLAVAAMQAPVAARDRYMVLASFHAWLELWAAVAFVMVGFPKRLSSGEGRLVEGEPPS